jgi:hypothetical protein
MTQFPDITTEVTVTAIAGPVTEACVKAVVTTLERALSMACGSQALCPLFLEILEQVLSILFSKRGTDHKIAAVNVQNRVSC